LLYENKYSVHVFVGNVHWLIGNEQITQFIQAPLFFSSHDPSCMKNSVSQNSLIGHYIGANLL